MRYNKVALEELSEAVYQKEDINISDECTTKAIDITIIKRDGRKQRFNPDKMRNVCLWACDGLTWMSDELIRDTEIKLHKEIHIRDMYKQLITTAVNKISLLYPGWEDVSAKLELISVYKETYNISKSNEYPPMSQVLSKGVDHKIYDKNTVGQYSDEDLRQIDTIIVPDRDLLFNYKGLVTFVSKYCLNYSKTKKLELPQHAYMRVAMTLMINEKNRIEQIRDLYDSLSKHMFTEATPIMLNSLTPGQQLSSCVLNTVNDDSHSILDTGKNLGIYSKFKGGTALDGSALRGKGAYINGTQGISSGPVPFIKYFESIMKAWNQGGKRPGALCVYFSWWHTDVFDILSLKSNGGTDENRARGVQYGCKLNQLFIDAVLNDEDVYLFDPKDAPELLTVFGDEFNELYHKLINKSSVRKRKVSARELNEKIFKERSETGNIYLFHSENVNNATLLNRYVGSSNLCTEIVLPSTASIQLSDTLHETESGDKVITKTYAAGEIALCNLSSINLERWFYLNDDERTKLVNIVVRALDNTVDIAEYPVKEGKNSNTMYRYLGIGVLNYTNYLALNKIVVDTPEAMEETDSLFDDLSYKIISASVDLAIEKGRFPKFYETEWADGVLPIYKANKKAIELTKYQPDMDKWDQLSDRVKLFGIRNAQLMAIAPTACQTKVGEIKTSTGIMSLEQIMDEQKIDHNLIENNQIKQWVNFDAPITIPTRLGDREVYRIWYNGKVPTRKITMEDGNVYEFSLNHKLLVTLEGGCKTWVKVGDLSNGMDIVCLD